MPALRLDALIQLFNVADGSGWKDVSASDVTAFKYSHENRHEITERYHLNYRAHPIDGILSDGTYIYGDFEFELDYERILSLLMGAQLGEIQQCIRELLQNAVDTCRHREALSIRLGVPYKAEIEFTQRTEPDGYI
jgi:hypothetical protein